MSRGYIIVVISVIIITNDLTSWASLPINHIMNRGYMISSTLYIVTLNSDLGNLQFLTQPSPSFIVVASMLHIHTVLCILLFC